MNKFVLRFSFLAIGFLASLFVLARFTLPASANCAPAGDATAQNINCGPGGAGHNYDAGAGNDTLNVIGNYTGSSAINGGADNDQINITGNIDNSIVEGGTGNDSITNSGTFDNFSALNGNFGNNTIINNGTFILGSALQGGTGNDSIINTGSFQVNSQIFTGDGNDIVINSANFSGASYIHGDLGNDTIINSGNFSGFSFITGSVGAALINNSGSFDFAALQTQNGNDTIINSGAFSSSLLTAGGGNDLIIITGDPNFDAASLIDGGPGTDTLSIQSSNPNAAAEIAAFLAGNDILTNCGGVCAVTIGGITYRFQNIEQLVGAFLQILQQTDAITVIAPSAPVTQQVCGTSAIKIFRLPNGDLEVFGGFEFAPPNGFFVALVDRAGLAQGVTRFQATEGLNAEYGWYAVFTRANPNFIEVFDRAGNLVGRCNL